MNSVHEIQDLGMIQMPRPEALTKSLRCWLGAVGESCPGHVVQRFNSSEVPRRHNLFPPMVD